ncbi:hypothetical protein FBU59_003804 [Linderina macrospora]|uniref:Uncharacterized protein n=1 Tax=Linderina macrospora TaxID=4868 RepID=A0ACC1J7B8_9FUNG|nr:hypothetical protein FBU59_003804 [Linderina macrospora]
MRYTLRSSTSQLYILSLVGLCGPGMMFALISLGSATEKSPDPDNMFEINLTLIISSVLTGLFSFLGCNILHRIGVRLCMFFSCIFMSVYSFAYAYRYIADIDDPPIALSIVSAALMGIGVGVFFSVQTTINIKYPHEEVRGRYLTIFAALFNLGGMLGGIIQFSLNYQDGENTGLSNYTYLSLGIVQVFGAFISLALVSPTKVKRDDNTVVMSHSADPILKELLKTVKHFVSKWALLFAVPYLVSHIGFAYTSNILNGAVFDARTRGFNNIFFWLSKTFGTALLGFILDYVKWSRRRRDIIVVAILTLASNGVWVGGIFDQKRLFPSGQINQFHDNVLDYTDSAAAPTIALYALYGLFIGIFDTCLMWFISLLSDDFDVTGRNVSVFRGLQAFGSAISWAMVNNMPISALCYTNWGLVLLSLCPLLYFALVILRNSTIPSEYDVDMEFAELRSPAYTNKASSEYYI